MRKRQRGLTKEKGLFEFSHFLVDEGIPLRDAREFLLNKKKRKRHN